MKLAWITDIHLNFLRPAAVDDFLRELADTRADAVVLTGDIGEASDVVTYLDALAAAVRRPVYFVLGNHDFYRGSIAGVRSEVEELCATTPNLHWMPRAGVVPLTETTCLVGHDGWGDGRFGDYASSTVALNDWRLIEELTGLGKRKLLDALHALGDESATHFRAVLPGALARFRRVIVATHVPPFREACWHEGRISGDEWLPHFTCKAAGDVLADMLAAHPDRVVTMLCGHTHSSGEAQIQPNLRVSTGGAVYGRPAIQRVIDVE